VHENDKTQERHSVNFQAQQLLLKNIRTEMAKLLKQEDVRKLFQEKVREYCEQLVRWSDPARPTVYTREATAFGAIGMVATLMKRGPYEMGDAYFLLAIVHDTGEFAKDVGAAAPPEWDLVAQSPASPERGLDLSDPQHFQWEAHRQWHLALRQVDMLTNDALKRLSAWVRKVRIAVAQRASGREDARSGGAEEEPWRDDAPDYMPLSEAGKTFASKMGLSSLSKAIKPGCGVRHMRKSRRCKVHIGDFRRWAVVTHSKPDDVDSQAEEAARRYAEILREKQGNR